MLVKHIVRLIARAGDAVCDDEIILGQTCSDLGRKVRIVRINRLLLGDMNGKVIPDFRCRLGRTHHAAHKEHQHKQHHAHQLLHLYPSVSLVLA